MADKEPVGAMEMDGMAVVEELFASRWAPETSTEKERKSGLLWGGLKFRVGDLLGPSRLRHRKLVAHVWFILENTRGNPCDEPKQGSWSSPVSSPVRWPGAIYLPSSCILDRWDGDHRQDLRSSRSRTCQPTGHASPYSRVGKPHRRFPSWMFWFYPGGEVSLLEWFWPPERRRRGMSLRFCRSIFQDAAVREQDRRDGSNRWCRRAAGRRSAAMESILMLGRRFDQLYTHYDLRCGRLGNDLMTASRHNLPYLQPNPSGDWADSHFHPCYLSRGWLNLQTTPRISLFGYLQDCATHLPTVGFSSSVHGNCQLPNLLEESRREKGLLEGEARNRN